MNTNEKFGENDYLLYDKENLNIAKYAVGRKYIIYNNKKEAKKDCLEINRIYGGVYRVVRCLDLPKYLQFAILCNINK